MIHRAAAPTEHYLALRLPTGGPWHLGSETLDLRTYCGVILQSSQSSQSLTDVDCRICRRTEAYRDATSQEAR